MLRYETVHYKKIFPFGHKYQSMEAAEGLEIDPEIGCVIVGFCPYFDWSIGSYGVRCVLGQFFTNN